MINFTGYDDAVQTLKTILDKKGYRRLLEIDNHLLHEFVAKYIDLCNPDKAFVSIGTVDDLQYIREAAIRNKEERRLAIKGHTVHFDNYFDQARDREHTLILISEGKDLGSKLKTGIREEKLREIHDIMRGIMRGHELFICFYTLGPTGSHSTIPCIQLTDSSYVAHSENILYRQGYEIFKKQAREARPFKFLHSQGELNDNRTSKNIDMRRVYIDIEGDTVYSINTQYGGNTIGLKKLAMRLAINRASKEGWLTEHMLIMGIHGPNNRTTYFSGAFPSMCGKTSTAMMEGETIIGDDIAYLIKRDDQVHIINVEKGVFGIIEGINSKDDPIQWDVLHSPIEVIFSNILVTDGGSAHWVGRDGNIPPKGYNHSGEWWIGKKDASGREIPCSHLNARFTVELKHFKNMDPRLEDPDGVTLSAIVYGGRDSNTSVPTQESFDWEHGIVTMGAALESETTAATLGAVGVREFNPMSNLDFLSIPIGVYVKNNLDFGKDLKKPPKIFAVNYFLTDNNGNYLNEKIDKQVWFKWMELRVNNEVDAIYMPTGKIPIYNDLKRLFKQTLDKEYNREDYTQQFMVRIQENLAKIDRVNRIYRSMENIPESIFLILDKQLQRLNQARENYGDYISPFVLAH